MSIIFSDNFNSGALTGWGSPNSLATVDLWGFGGTFCVGCSNASSQSRKTLASPISNVGSIRAQVAGIFTLADTTNGLLIFNIQDFNAGVGTNNFQLLVYLRPDGRFRIRWNNNGVGTFINSSAGSLFPADGTQFGLQIRFEIAATNTVIFTVNNIDVATINWTHSARANQWDDIWIYGNYTNTAGSPPVTRLTTVDNYEADDDNTAVSWPAGTAPKLDANFVCFSGPATATITVQKITLPTDPLSFDFTTTGGLSPSTFSLSDGDSQVFTVPAGIYGIVEVPVPAYIASIVVSNGDLISAITVADGDDVTVTVTNVLTPPYSGIYKYDYNTTRRSDRLYLTFSPVTTIDVKIPDIKAVTSLIGED